jgi:hypothetical protein
MLNGAGQSSRQQCWQRHGQLRWRMIPTDKERDISLSVVVLCTGTPNAHLAQYPTTPTSAGRISLHQLLRDLFWFRLAILAAQ